MIYLGTLDRMIGLDCPAEQSVSHAGRVSTVSTVEGRVKAMVVPESGRSWSIGVSAGARQSASATLQEFAVGAWGPGPFIFVPADAPLTNMLSPHAAASMDTVPYTSATLGGPVDLGQAGWSPASQIIEDATSSSEIYATRIPTPVFPGRAVTGSAWISPGANLTAQLCLYWRDVNGGIVSGTARSAGVSSPRTRVSVTGMPPVGAAYVQLVAQQASMMTRPQITWTDSPVPWAAGEGCPQAVVHDLSRSQSTAWPGSVLSSVQYTVTEVM